MKQEQKSLIAQLRNVKSNDVTPGTFDLLERIDCPWIRIARDKEGRVITDAETHAPMLANDIPTMAEFGKTVIVLLSPHNPNVIQWITTDKINDISNKLLDGLKNIDLSEAYMEIRRILQVEEKSKENSDDQEA